MDVTAFASGSKGNCYAVSDQHTTLLIECGISIQRIKEGLGFRLSQVTGCFVSHEHHDHCKAAEKVMKAGIDLYMSEGTKDSLGLTGHRIHTLKPKQQYNIGSMSVMPFHVQHDAAEPMGFLIRSRKTKEKLVYITDSYYSRYRFPGLNYIMLECNYAEDILDANVEGGRVHIAQKKRLLQSHFSLENVKDFLQANDLSDVKEIYLMHLSETNSDAERFKKEIQELTGRQVTVC
jgi:phosphoribosyl 1,2-cyclic phosphodiesterase